MEALIGCWFLVGGGSGGAKKAGRLANALLSLMLWEDLVFNSIFLLFLYLTVCHTLLSHSLLSGPACHHSPPEVSNSSGYPPSFGRNSMRWFEGDF